MTYQLIRKYRLDVFILISFLLHLFFAFMSGFVEVAKNLPKKMDPVKVTLLEKKKPIKKPALKGQIIETPKPKKEEKPLSQNILSQFNSRMRSNVGKKAERYRDHKTAIPLSRPRPAAPAASTARKEPLPAKKTIEKEVVPEKLTRVPEAKRKFKDFAKLEKNPKKKVDFSKSLIRKKYRQGNQNNKSTSESENEKMDKKSFLAKSSLLDGTDLEKYARLDTGGNEKEEPTADSDTISLDTQEFKYVSYFAQIKRKIELVWSYPPEAGRQGLSGKLLLKFTILKNGTLAKLELIDSSGHKILDDEALRAVGMASPYPPFPKRIDKKRLHIIASFSYYPSFSLVH